MFLVKGNHSHICYQLLGMVWSGRSGRKKKAVQYFWKFQSIWVAPIVPKICRSSIRSRVMYYYSFQMCLWWTCTRLQMLLNLWWFYDVCMPTNIIFYTNAMQNTVFCFNKNESLIRTSWISGSFQTHFL